MYKSKPKPGRTAATAIAMLLASFSASADVDPDARREDGSTPLQWAAFQDDAEQAARLIAAGADVDAQNNYGVNALLLAADIASTELVRLLLEHGANADSANPDGETALHLIARSGNVEAAKLLLKAGAPVDPREQFGGQTPLMWAVARRHPAMVELLVGHGADTDARSAVRDYQRVATAESRAKSLDRGGFTPLLYAARENCRECADILVRHGADLNLADPGGVSPLVIALINGNFDIAKRLIEAGADVDQWDMFGQAPLHVAIGALGGGGGRGGGSGSSGNPLDSGRPQQASAAEVVQLLIGRGANPNQQVYYPSAVRGGFRGTTPLLVAVGTGDLELVRQLIAHGANVRLATSEGQGAIHAAVQARSARAGGAGSARRANPKVELIRFLVEQGADLNIMAERNWRYRTRGGSALHYAVRSGDLQVVRALVELGIDINARDDDGVTALDYAMSRGFLGFQEQRQPPNLPIADYLRSAGANVELDWTPDWPRPGAPLSTNAYDSILWPVDPKGP